MITNKEAITYFKRHLDLYCVDGISREAEEMAIKALEQQKTGHWIVEVWNNKKHHTCSVCQKVVDYEPCYHYCPYCGAEMAESDASIELDV